jgi:hypothetical protein
MSTPVTLRWAATSVAAIGIVLSACSSDPAAPRERPGSAREAETVGGCACPTSGTCGDVSFSNVPTDNSYYITTFGGGSDTQSMACGGTADATWAYVADEARFGCGAKLLVTANGLSCVAQVADCGPNQCVELAAANSGCTTGQPVLDASPYITQYLFGVGSAGWSDALSVTATLVDPSTPIGCPAAVALPEAGAPEAGDPDAALPVDAGSVPPAVDASPSTGDDANDPPSIPTATPPAPTDMPPAPSVGTQASGGEVPAAGASPSLRSGCEATGHAPDADALVLLGASVLVLARAARRRHTSDT